MDIGVVTFVEASLWVLITVVLCFVGDGHNDLISILLHDPRITRYGL